MGRVKDITNQRFGMLVAKELVTTNPRAIWKCLCDCGKYINKRSADLSRRCPNKSCGCTTVKTTNATKKQKGIITHGRTRTPEWNAWKSMKGRCKYGDPHYVGITVCDRWLGPDGFINFLSDVGEKPNPDLTLERIDPHKNYCPDNCKWDTRSVQSMNQKRHKVFTYNGKSLHITEWAKETGINKDTIGYRLKKGWSVEDAVTIPPRGKRNG